MKRSSSSRRATAPRKWPRQTRPSRSTPTNALLYYIKGQGLIQNATVDPKTNRIVLPPDCTAAYQKYLDLAPNGQFANEVAGILQQAGEKISSSYKAPPKSH